MCMLTILRMGMAAFCLRLLMWHFCAKNIHSELFQSKLLNMLRWTGVSTCEWYTSIV